MSARPAAARPGAARCLTQYCRWSRVVVDQLATSMQPVPPTVAELKAKVAELQQSVAAQSEVISRQQALLERLASSAQSNNGSRRPARLLRADRSEPS